MHTLMVVLALVALTNAHRSPPNRDLFGNVLEELSPKYLPSRCCLTTDCDQTGSRCYQTVRCGYSCSSGRYPPAQYPSTPGYRLKKSYSKYECRFENCRYFDFTCGHCQDPKEADFSIYLARDDCKECYERF